MRKKSAFTLIELLVVIAILALLISILIPSLSRARQAAKTAVCASNMRGIMQALYLYAGDHRDQIVGVGLAHGGGHGNDQAAWINTLRQSYGENTLIARCPQDESDHWALPIAPPPPAADADGGQGDETMEPILRRTSFGTNYYIAGEVAGRGPYNQLGKIKRPITTIFMAELVEVGPFATSDHVHPENWWSNPRSLAAQEMALDRHRKKANYSFFDAHVGTHSFEETYSIDNERTNRRTGIVWKRNYYDPNVAQ